MTAVATRPPTGVSSGRAVRKFRPDIEGLRAVAVAFVVLNHLALGLPGGYVGVDVFFVISGFLITRQLMSEYERTNHISFMGFYARRARRILPAATVVILGTLLATRHWDSPLRLHADALDGLFSAFSGINWRLAAEGTNYFAAGTAPSPFQHFWSLAVEEQFYAIWPLLIIVVGSTFGRRYGRRSSIVWSLLTIMAVSLSLSIVSSAGSPSWAYFGIQTRAWELAFGALLGATVTMWTRMPPALACQMSWLGLGLIGLSGFLLSAATVYPGRAVIMPVVGSALVIAGGCPGWARSGELLLKQAPFQFVGRVSYSWYLVHWPVLMILPMAVGHPVTTAEKWYVLVGSLAISVAMYYVVEQPVRTRAWLVRRPQYGLSLGALLAAGSVALAVTFSQQTGLRGGSGVVQEEAATSDASGVAAAVTAGASLSDLPSNVTPSLAQAANDRPASTGPCLAADNVTAPPPTANCTFGDVTATRTIALVGDSHANAWEPAFDSFARARGWRLVLFTKAGCPPGDYPSDVDPNTHRIYTQCNEWRDAVFARIAVVKPAVVVFTSELRTEDIDPTGMVKSVKKAQSLGSRVIYVEDTPNPEVVGAVPDCLAENTRNIEKCAMQRNASTTRLEGMIQRRTEAGAVKAAGATLIDPTDWFCTATVCPPVVNDIIVYADNSHTTASYVTWLAPVMSTALGKATGGA